MVEKWEKMGSLEAENSSLGTKEYYYASTDDEHAQGPTLVFLMRGVRLKSQNALGTGAKREAGVLSEGWRGQVNGLKYDKGPR